MRNNIKISFEKPIYTVDEKNGVVICVLKYKADAPSNVIFASSGTIYSSPWYDTYSVKAIARVRDNDKFDANVGKKVSLAKAENLAYSHVNDLVKSARISMCRSLYAIRSFSRKVNKVKKHNIEYMKKF